MTNNNDNNEIDEEETTIDIIENEPTDYQPNENQTEQQPRTNKPRMLGIFLTLLLALCLTIGVTYYHHPNAIPSKEAAHLDVELEEKDEFRDDPLAEEEFEYFAGMMVSTSPPIPNENKDETNEIDSNNNNNKSPSLKSLAERMTPRNILYNNTLETTTTTTFFPPKQFFHLHHMKTGGTSIDALLRCATTRLSTQLSTTLPTYSLSECGYAHYQKCISHEDTTCVDNIQHAATMSFCAPLAQTNAFEWNEADAITTIRNPIDRVWSMYRFTTKHCYCCLPLKEIYEKHEAGTLEKECADAYKGVCMGQLYNHQTRNLLTTLDADMEGMEEEKKVEEAVWNLENRFTVVGLTHELVDYVKMLGVVFPWLSEDGIDFGNDGQEEEEEKQKCVLEHKNSSPSNNHCGEDGGHLELGDEPDEETRQAIEERNKLDMEVFRKAVRHFRRQKKALGWDLTEEDEEQ